MPRDKIRRIDLYPDDFIAGVAGELTEVELGVYWMICLLCYARDGTIKYDPDWLRRKFRPSKGNWVVKSTLDRLIAMGKVERDGDQITVRRVSDEYQRALRRVADSRQNGMRGGRPPKHINGIENPLGSPARGSNQQSANINQTTRDAREARSVSLKAEFAEWWVAYPHKVGKGAAETKFRIARKTAPLAELIEGVRRYVQTKPEDRAWCNPATWLNQRRWEDQPALSLLAPQGGIDDIIRVPTGPAPTVEQVYGRRSLDDPLSGHQDRR